MEWYALFVETGKEEVIQKWLDLYFSKEKLKSFIFKKKVTEKKQGIVYEKVRKVFPGYIFLNTEMNEEIYYRIKKIPRYVKVLNLGNYYSKIDYNEINPILKLVDNNFMLDYSQIAIKDSKIIVKSGTLKNMEHIIKKVDKRKKRAKIQLEFMKTTKLIDVGIELIDNE